MARYDPNRTFQMLWKDEKLRLDVDSYNPRHIHLDYHSPDNSNIPLVRQTTYLDNGSKTDPRINKQAMFNEIFSGLMKAMKRQTR